ncbi:MAG: hypothetical protein MI922_13895, partial [Bacteroidales bacterium]|nr:hypothetical protein [Bacteroidales bacterium]
KVLATGFPSVNDAIGNPLNRVQLQCLGVAPEYSTYEQQRATYLKLDMDDKKQIGSDFTKDFELAFVFSDIMECNLLQSSNGIGKIIKHAMHGPPEKCYYSDSDISETPGIITSEFHAGKSVFFPWMIGELYNFKGNHAHKALFMGALKEMLEYKPQLTTNAPPLIEMTRNVSKNGHFEWIGMVNHSGQIGMSHLEPIPIHHFEIKVGPLKKVKSIRLLRENKSLPVVKNGDKLLLNIQVVKDFEVVVLEYDV